MLSIFSCSVGHLYLFLGEMSIQCLAPVLNRVLGLFRIHSVTPLAILDIYLFLDIYHLFISSPKQQVAFFFCWQFPLLCKSFVVWWTPICLFLLLLLLSEKTCQKKKLAKTDVKEHTGYVFWEFYGLRSNNFNFNLLLLLFIFECCVRKGSSFPITIYWRDSIFPDGGSWLLCHRLISHMSSGLFLAEHLQLYPP